MAEKVIVHVFAIHRHGDRAPMTLGLVREEETEQVREYWENAMPSEEDVAALDDAFPITGIPVTEREKATFLGSRLTKKGVEQLKTGGQMLRERYREGLDAFPGYPSPSLMDGITTPFTRTRQSMQALLSGLFPEHVHGVRERDGMCLERARMLSLQSIPFEDSILLPDNCVLANVGKYFLAMFEEDENADPHIAAFETEERKRKHRIYYEKMKSLLTSMGVQEQTVLKSIFCHDSLVCARAHSYADKLTVPETEVDTLRQELERINLYIFRSVFQNPINAKRGPGRLLKSILSEGVASLRCHKDYARLTVYSGHDNTVTPFLTVAGKVDDGKYATYGTLVTVEFARLHDNTGTPTSINGETDDEHLKDVITIRFNDEPIDVGPPIGRVEDVPLHQYIAFCSPLLPEGQL